MVTLPTWIEAHRTDHARATFWLVDFGLETPVYLTDCEQPIYYGGHEYVPTPLRVDGIQADAASASANGGQLTLASGGPHWELMLAAIAGGKRDFDVTLSEAWLDVESLPSAVPPENAVRIVATTKTEAAKWNRTSIAFTLGPSADPAVSRLPFRDYSYDLCTYRKFKGAQCGYSGSATTCDRKFTTCQTLGNEARYGGGFTIYAAGKTFTWQWDDNWGSYSTSVEIGLREP